MRDKKKKPFSESRKYSKYKVDNWPEYNEFLRNRGRIDVMISNNLAKGWYEQNTNGYRKRGGQRRYSDKAITICLQIRYIFALKLRQTQGFINWLFEVMGLKLKCPDYTTLSKRSKELNFEYELEDKEFDYITIDSSGIQTYTGNEWLENKHGKRYNRRIWKKLHIVTEDNGNILANSMTAHTTDDRTEVKQLLKNIIAKELLADCGYDGEAMYQLLRSKGIKPTIRPPNQPNASVINTERRQTVAYKCEKGYDAWRVKNNYGRREKVENTFFRFKTSFGSKFLSRDDKNMKNELTIKCQLLNKMFEIGKPISIPAY